METKPTPRQDLAQCVESSIMVCVANSGSTMLDGNGNLCLNLKNGLELKISQFSLDSFTLFQDKFGMF